jgi:hypothetical protein
LQVSPGLGEPARGREQFHREALQYCERWEGASKASRGPRHAVFAYWGGRGQSALARALN